MATKTFKIGLSATDKTNMAQDIYEQVEDLLFEEYDSTETYNTNDYVVYSGVLYRALQDNITGTWDNTKWQTATLNDLVDDVNSAVASVTGKANIIDLENGTLVPEKSSVAKNLEPVSSASGSTQTAPFINQGTATNNNDSQSEVDTGTLGQHLEKQGNTLVVNQLAKELNATNWTQWSYNTILSFDNGVATFSPASDSSYGDIRQNISIPQGHKVVAYFSAKATNTIPGTATLLLRGSGNNLDYNFVSELTTSFKNFYSQVFTLDANKDKIQFITNGEISIKDVVLVDLTQMFNGDIPQDLLNNPSHFSWFYNGSLAYNTGELVNSNGRYIVNGGQNVLNPSATYNRVIPNRGYVYKHSSGTATTITYYDKDKNSLGTESVSSAESPYSNASFTTPSNCYYITSSVATNCMVCLYYSGESYDDVVAYETPKVYDTGSEVLRSAGSVKDYKEPNGTIHRLVGNRAYQSGDENDSSLLTDGTTTNYPLVTPTTEQGTAFTENMDINDMGNMAWYSAYTDENTNTLVSVPQGCKIFYPAWYVGFLDTLGQREDIGWSADKIVSEDELNASETARDSVDTQLKNAIGGTLRQCLCVKESLDFDNTDFVDLGTLTWSYNSNYSFQCWYTNDLSNLIKGASNSSTSFNGVSTNYIAYDQNTFVSDTSKNGMFVSVSSSSTKSLFIRNGSSTEKPNGLLAYEKA